MDKKIRYNPNCAMCQGKGFYIVGNTSGTQSTTHNCDCHVFYDIKENNNDFIDDVVCSCYMCGKSIEQSEEQYDMYGEMVCKDCWNYNMYQALQDGGGI